MKALGTIKVEVKALSQAMAAVVPSRRKNARKKKPFPITLAFFANEQMLGVKEAYHASRGFRFPADGHWPKKVQVDGQMLRALIEKYEGGSVVELVALDEELAISQGRSEVRLKRIDAGSSEGIVETAPSPDGRHQGPVAQQNETRPSGRFEWNDTWLFSARVPFPQHRQSTGEADSIRKAKCRGEPQG